MCVFVGVVVSRSYFQYSKAKGKINLLQHIFTAFKNFVMFCFCSDLPIECGDNGYNVGTKAPFGL